MVAQVIGGVLVEACADISIHPMKTSGRPPEEADQVSAQVVVRNAHALNPQLSHRKEAVTVRVPEIDHTRKGVPAVAVGCRHHATRPARRP